MKGEPKAPGLVFALLLLLVLSATVVHAQNNTALKSWYNKPSGMVWENALPIGNGRLGGMIYGNVDTETIQLNEHTLWSGGPNRNDNPLALDSLAEIRKLFFQSSLFTEFKCPSYFSLSNLKSTLKFSVSQIFIVLSRLAVAKYFLSGLKTIE